MVVCVVCQGEDGNFFFAHQRGKAIMPQFASRRFQTEAVLLCIGGNIRVNERERNFCGLRGLLAKVRVPIGVGSADAVMQMQCIQRRMMQCRIRGKRKKQSGRVRAAGKSDQNGG